MKQDERWDEIWNEKKQASSGRLGAFLAKDIIHRTVTGILKREIPDPGGLRVMEEQTITPLGKLLGITNLHYPALIVPIL